MQLSTRQVYALARSVGLNHDQAVTATAVAMAESHLDTDILGDVSLANATWGPSVGLWQVRSLRAQYGTGGTRDAAHLTNPAFNARSMLAISNGGTSWGAWSTYSNGAYRDHVAAVSKAVGNGTKYDQGSAPAGTTASSVDWKSTLGDGLKAGAQGLIPGGPLGGKVIGKGTDLLGDGARAAAGALWDADNVRKLLITGAVVVGGLALVLVGTAATARGTG